MTGPIIKTSLIVVTDLLAYIAASCEVETNIPSAPSRPPSTPSRERCRPRSGHRSSKMQGAVFSRRRQRLDRRQCIVASLHLNLVRTAGECVDAAINAVPTFGSQTLEIESVAHGANLSINSRRIRCSWRSTRSSTRRSTRSLMPPPWASLWLSSPRAGNLRHFSSWSRQSKRQVGAQNNEFVVHACSKRRKNS
jgi:hypothetical protein